MHIVAGYPSLASLVETSYNIQIMHTKPNITTEDREDREREREIIWTAERVADRWQQANAPTHDTRYNNTLSHDDDYSPKPLRPLQHSASQSQSQTVELSADKIDRIQTRKDISIFMSWRARSGFLDLGCILFVFAFGCSFLCADIS